MGDTIGSDDINRHIAGFACVFISIMLGGDIASFIDPASIFIVFGGVICATLASFPMNGS
jgi:chemotaxis protein MotA